MNEFWNHEMKNNQLSFVHNRITAVDIDWENQEITNVIFHFNNKPYPWRVTEFKAGSRTRLKLEKIIELLKEIDK
ncbi:MAG: hypothetical protein AABY22_21945 [Nanoarchaeota archaeon]